METLKSWVHELSRDLWCDSVHRCKAKVWGGKGFAKAAGGPEADKAQEYFAQSKAVSEGMEQSFKACLLGGTFDSSVGVITWTIGFPPESGIVHVSQYTLNIRFYL